MIHKFKRLVKKYSVLFYTFFLINIFFIWIVMNILNVEEDLKTQHSLISSEAKTISFRGQDDIYKDELINILESKKVILESIIMINNDEVETEIQGIYYNYAIDKKYPLIEGRMFMLEEIKEKKKVALVGYNLKDSIKNNTIKIQNQDYEVVGILGEKQGDALKDSIYINLNSQDFNLNMKVVTIDVANEKVSEVTMKIFNELNKIKKVEIDVGEPIGNDDPLKQAMGEKKIHIIMGLLASVCLISTVINISIYLIENEKSIIGIKSLVGGTKKMLAFKFWINYQFTIGLSLIFSYVVWVMYNGIYSIDYLLVLKSLVALILINIIVSTLSIIPSIIKLNKMNVNSIIKENT